VIPGRGVGTARVKVGERAVKNAVLSGEERIIYKPKLLILLRRNVAQSEG
jgi:hypothetical protein